MTRTTDWTARKHFFLESVKNVRQVASVIPSSRYLTRAMLQRIDFGAARHIVEFGTGIGNMTSRILAHMTPDARLYSFELNIVFIRHVTQRLRDPRLEIINDSAEELASQLESRDVTQVDAVVSSLGLTSMHPEVRRAILEAAHAQLKPGGVFTQFQYCQNLHAFWNPATHTLQYYSIEAELRTIFRSVTRTSVLRNLPPAFIFTCET